MASYFVDIDSITTNADSLTYFRGHSSSAYDIITEVEVQCDQDFESGKVSMRERTYSYGGVSQTTVSSLSDCSFV